MNKRTLRLLREALPAARKSGVPFAVGGGVAVNVHGYERATKDVDLFFARGDRHSVLRAFREAGFEIDPAITKYHYFAIPSWSRSARERVDIVFPTDPIPVDAISDASVVRRWRVQFPVFSSEHLALAKLESERARDQGDVETLYDTGAFDPEEARSILRRIDPGYLKIFERHLKRLQEGEE